MSSRGSVVAGLAILGLFPAALGAQPAPSQPAAPRPSAVERPWSGDPDSPYARAHAVAAEHAQGTTGLEARAPGADAFHSATLTAFRTESSIWRQQPVYVGWDWYSGGYPTLLAAPRSPSGAGLWVVFPAPWMDSRLEPSRRGSSGTGGRGRAPGPPRGRGRK